jgi:ATP-dependent RNA helicase RhlE
MSGVRAAVFLLALPSEHRPYSLALCAGGLCPYLKESVVTHFNDLGLAAAVLRAVENEGYTTPTPIQEQAIPLLLQGRDLLGIAQTGTGKTAAFALPILHKLVSDRQRPQSRRTRVLVMAPTRELVSQIAESFRSYGRHAQMQIATVFGGVSYGPQVKALGRGLDILVATPGRLLDHLQQGTVRLDETEIVVLDEADHMLDLGFIIPIREIVAKLPKDRQTLFFSATMPKEIAKLAGEMLDNPAQVTVKPEGTTAERVDQSVYMVDAGAKNTLLVHLLKQKEFERTLIFTRTKRGADKVTKLLAGENISSQAIHGNKSQAQREKALNLFKRGLCQTLVATDIAARGIDVDSVTHVVNYELPDVPEAYVHRIGRTARAGAAGKAIAFCDRSERGSLRDIQRLTRITIPAFVWSQDKGVTPIEVSPEDLRSEGPARRRSGNRPQGRSAGGRPDFSRPRSARPFDGQRTEGRHNDDRNNDNRSAEGETRRERPARARSEGHIAPAGDFRHERQDKAAHSKPANGKPGQGRSTEGRSAEGRPGRARPEFSKPGNASGEKRSWGEFRGDSRSEPRTDRPRTEHGASAGINKSPKKPHRKGQNGYAGQRADGPRADSQPVAASRPNFNKPNRPGQRRRKKMQAEREGMAAAV